MTTRIFTSLSTAGVVGSQNTPSARTLGKQPAKYYDPLTGETVEAPTGLEILQELDKAGKTLLDKDGLIEAIFDEKLTGTTTGRALRADKPGAEAKEWDVVHFDLSGQPDLDRARDLILEQLMHPRVAFTKNQGGGRFQDIVFEGDRAVLAWAIHTDQEAGPHFMAYLSTYAINDKKEVSPRVSVADSSPRQATEEQINAALTAAGLQPIAMTSAGASPMTAEAKKAGLTAENDVEFREARQRGEVPEIDTENLPDLDMSSKVDLMRQAQNQAERESATLWSQANVAAQRAKTYAQALQAVQAEADLRTRLDAMAQDVAAIKAAQEAAQAEAAQALEQNEQLTGKLTETSGKLDEAQEQVAELGKDLADIEASNEDLTATLAEVVQVRDTLNVRVAEVEGERNTAKGQAEQFEALAAEREADANTVRAALKEETAQAQAAQAKADTLHKQVDTLTGKLETAEARAKREADARTAAEAALAEKAASLREALKEKVKAESANDRLRAELDERPTAAALAKAEAQARREASARETAENDRDLANEQIKDLRAALAAARADAATAKANLAQAPTVEALAEAKSEAATAVAERDQARDLAISYRHALEAEKAKPKAEPDGPGGRNPGGRTPR